MSEKIITCNSCGKRKFSKAFIKGNTDTCIKCLYKETIEESSKRSKKEYIKKLPSDRTLSKCPLCQKKHIGRAKYSYCVNCRDSESLKVMPWDFI